MCGPGGSRNWKTFPIPSTSTTIRSSSGVRVLCGMRIAECGKSATGNLRKIACGTFRKLPVAYATYKHQELWHFKSDLGQIFFNLFRMNQAICFQCHRMSNFVKNFTFFRSTATSKIASKIASRLIDVGKNI